MAAVRDALIVALAALAGCSRSERPGFPPRHVLLVTVEGLRADRCSFLMHSRPTTMVPSDELERFEGRAMGLDDLAATGVVFAHCYAPSPDASVSIASIMTGRPLLEHGVQRAGDALPGEMITLAECFSRAGFRTAAFTAQGDLDFAVAFGQGFGEFRACSSDAAALDAAAAWFQGDLGDDRELFAWIHLRGPALPWREPVDPRVEERIAPRTFVDPAYHGPVDGSDAFVAGVRAGTVALDRSDRAALSARYDLEVARATAGLWRTLHDSFDYFQTGAAATEVWARTVLVVAGTNGTQLAEENAVGSAGTLHESVLHVPLVLRHPDSLTGERIVDRVVELEDVAPTLLEWLELPRPAGMRGRSLLALLDTYVKRDFDAHPAFAAIAPRILSARTERWHLVWNQLGGAPRDRASAAPRIGEVVLYDTGVDPAERHDLAADEPGVVASLQQELRTWMKSQRVFPVDRRPHR